MTLESTMANGRSGTSPYTISPREETWDDGLRTTFCLLPLLQNTFLPTFVCMPAWLLEQVRMDVPSDLIKLRPGSAVCLQDLSLSLCNSFYAPTMPTMLGVIDRMLWHEEGYQITSVGTCCEYTDIFPFFFIIYSLYYFSDIFSTLIIWTMLFRSYIYIPTFFPSKTPFI